MMVQLQKHDISDNETSSIRVWKRVHRIGEMKELTCVLPTMVHAEPQTMEMLGKPMFLALQKFSPSSTKPNETTTTQARNESSDHCG
jgi:hypothetical protein